MRYVTVLITLRNNVSTIKQCIDSLLKIDYPKYRIMVVDAFSNDGSYEALKSYGKKIDLYQVKGWAPTAYNWALKKIESEYIALVDGDCVVPNDWLTELMKGFTSPDVVEVAGRMLTPKTTNKLQEAIGLDLEDRYANLGDSISKVPTMNVAFKTSMAKNVRFNEKLRVGYDADFSFRLTKFGKIKYVPDAVMFHHHRATWKALFRQQYITASMMPTLYWKHKSKISGDSISRPSMIAQPFLAYGFLLSLMVSIFRPSFYIVPAFSLALLLAIYIIDTLSVSRKAQQVPWLLGFYFVRTIGWCAGLMPGTINILKEILRKN